MLLHSHTPAARASRRSDRSAGGPRQPARPHAASHASSVPHAPSDDFQPTARLVPRGASTTPCALNRHATSGDIIGRAGAITPSSFATLSPSGAAHVTSHEVAISESSACSSDAEGVATAGPASPTFCTRGPAAALTSSEASPRTTPPAQPAAAPQPSANARRARRRRVSDAKVAAPVTRTGNPAAGASSPSLQATLVAWSDLVPATAAAAAAGVPHDAAQLPTHAARGSPRHLSDAALPLRLAHHQGKQHDAAGCGTAQHTSSVSVAPLAAAGRGGAGYAQSSRHTTVDWRSKDVKQSTGGGSSDGSTSSNRSRRGGGRQRSSLPRVTMWTCVAVAVASALLHAPAWLPAATDSWRRADTHLAHGPTLQPAAVPITASPQLLAVNAEVTAAAGAGATVIRRRSLAAHAAAPGGLSALSSVSRVVGGMWGGTRSTGRSSAPAVQAARPPDSHGASTAGGAIRFSVAAASRSPLGGRSPVAAAAAAASASQTPSPAGGGGGDGTGPGHEQAWRQGAAVRVITVVSEGVDSPFRTTWDELVRHSAQRLAWTDPSYQMLVFTDRELAGEGSASRQRFLAALSGGPHVLLGLDVAAPGASAFLESVKSQLPPVRLFFGTAGAPELQQLEQLGWNLSPHGSGIRESLARLLPWTPDGKALKAYELASELLARHTSDDFLYIYLVLINQFVSTVPSVANTTKGSDLPSIWCMVTKCGQQIVGCLQNPTCKAGLDCLNGCAFNDQVCQYRCIVSYETTQFEQFALCILQKHNCRGLSAEPPALPAVAPMSSFRGVPMTHDIAESMFLGWMKQPPGLQPSLFGGPLTGSVAVSGGATAGAAATAAAAARTAPAVVQASTSVAGSAGTASTAIAGSATPSPVSPDSVGGAAGDAAAPAVSETDASVGGVPLLQLDKPFSWYVAAGKNPAYDFFPCQAQLYYRGKGKGTLWYEPIFKALTLDGREVWRRRRYRVRRGPEPATFYLSVLDNGVTSNEFWRIVDCDEGLQWCLFYYTGAASAAGLSYSGAVLGTKDGRFPTVQHHGRLKTALRAAGIEMWELSYVDNSNCVGADLTPTVLMNTASA